MTVPPPTPPWPRTVNRTLSPRPPSSIVAPSSRSAASSGRTGRADARSSPRNSTSAVVSAATGGTNRSTVPAFPTSTIAPRAAFPAAGSPRAGGVTSQAGAVPGPA